MACSLFVVVCVCLVALFPPFFFFLCVSLLLGVCRLWFVMLCRSLFVCCFLFPVFCSCFVVGCLLFVELLFLVCSQLFVTLALAVCCLLFAVWCLSFVVVRSVLLVAR